MADPERVRIVDFSTHLSGPLATHLLSELGADVVKVENPRTGDGNRGIFPVVDDVGMLDLALNSGARSVAADIRSPRWPALVAAAARWADAVVVGARPVDAKRRGLDFDSLSAANDRLVYLSVSGFGETGPWRDNTAHGQTLDGYAGLVDVIDGGVQPLTRPGWRTSGTTLGGVFTALGVMSALVRRERGYDRAQYVSVSIWHAAVWWSWRDIAMLTNRGERWLDYSDLGSRYSLYRDSRGEVMLLAPSERRFWERFVDLVGLPAQWRTVGDWAQSGMDHGEGPRYAHERPVIAERIATRTRDEWMAAFAEAEIPAAPILDLESVLGSEHAELNAVVRDVTYEDRTLQVAASPLRFGSGPGKLEMPVALRRPPKIGEHTDEVVTDWGVAPSDS